MGLSLKDIYNNSLQKVSRSRITAVDDGSYEANLCNELFTRVLDNTLYEHPWSSCMKRIALTKLSEAPAAKYVNAFQLPNDCVRLVQAYYDSGAESFDFQWQIEGRTLVTDAEAVYIWYVFRPTNYEQLNSPLIECLVYKMAIELATPLQLERDDALALRQEYETNILPRAKALDSSESRYVEFEENPWVEALYRGYPGEVV